MRSQSIIPRAGLLGISAIAVMVGSVASPALAASCPLAGQQVAGIEQSMVVDAACIDPDYNETTFKLDKVERKTLVLPDSSNILYTEVTGHFPATRIALPVGITPSPTTASHRITWRFPDKAHWRNRFFQQTYPLPFDILNTVDDRFAFTNGGFTVGITPGNSNVGYRVSAAAAKLAKAYADKLYGNTARIYGYLYGQSGGSAQAIGASEGTTGVWDGIIPVVIATDGLTVHSFQWANLYAIAIPQAKREAIAKAAAPGSGRDIYAGLNEDEIAILNELLSAGFARQALEDMKFTAGFGQGNLGAIGDLDPTYEEDFWSKPGYEGVDPPAWLTAASVDGLATITGVARNGQGTPTSVSFDPATLPKLGSIGAEGLQFHVYAADGTTRITNGQARTLGGNLAVGSLNLNGTNDPVLLAALTDGGKIRITNRALLATAFYPRHAIPENGNPAYDQYRNKDGSFRYAQRPFNIAHFGNVKASGGLRQTGNIKAKTMVIENLVDPSSYPYTAAFYASQVERALGPTRADKMLRVYYQESATHGAFLPVFPGQTGTSLVPVGGILHQAMLDLAAWVERGIAPLPSSSYRLDTLNQVILPSKASKRLGLQPVLHLTANGGARAEVGVNQPVSLSADIAMPPRSGQIVQYDWYLGTDDFKFEPPTTLAKPQTRVTAKRTVTFPKAGEYVVTLRVFGQRNGIGDVSYPTILQNLARVRIVVR
jgi:hypothetical protein